MYQIKYSHGQTETGINTYEDAVSRVRTVYGEVEIGHSGDLNDGGPTTLVWLPTVPEADRDGSRACCSIRRVYE